MHARTLVCVLVALSASLLQQPVHGQYLFVGLETSPVQPTKSSDLSGFPNVTWANRFALDVSGAAATPEGKLYLCNGAFTTHLYGSTLTGPPQHLCVIDKDMHALAYGRNTLWGYSNFAEPKGIYEIDPATGTTTLVLDVYSGPGFRFFGLDYNAVDGRLYGYTEYGVSGLYRIDIDTGEMTFVAGPIPAANSQGRALAVGNNTVYLAATRGDEQIPLFAYDLTQGTGGQWVGFTNPYPAQHATGGAAWIPDPTAGVNGAPLPAPEPGLRLERVGPNPTCGRAELEFHQAEAGPTRLDIVDASGRVVAAYAAGELPAGSHTLHWNGEDRSGARVGAGTYYLRLSGGGGTATGALIVVR